MHDHEQGLISVALGINRVYQRLRARVQDSYPLDLLNVLCSEKPVAGAVTLSGFTLRVNGLHRSAAGPRLIGQVIGTGYGCRISYHIRRPFLGSVAGLNLYEDDGPALVEFLHDLFEDVVIDELAAVR